MSTAWQLQDAKNRFSAVVDKAMHSGPQEITRRGVKAAVVMSYRDYTRLKARSRRSLVEFFRDSPLRGLDVSRSSDHSREVRL